MGKSCSKGSAPVTQEFDKKYKLSQKILGEGAYGKVVLGATLRGDERVAVKLMDKGQMKARDGDKMYKEVQILKSLKHPNVVKVFDFYDEQDYFKIVMEYVDGGELFEKLVAEGEQYTERESRESLHTLAKALKHCKDRGVVHRDIKPENILLTKSGEIKLADFNLSKQIDVDMVDFKLLQTMCGTPNYVAPEVLSGKPYDFKCDVWSLGVIAFLLLSGGYLPFFIDPNTEGKNELLDKVRKGQWSFSPERAWRDVSKEAKDLISHMLVKNPAKRYNYNQVLSHPWFKDSKVSPDAVINGKRIMSDLEKRRLWVTAHLQNAIGIFKDLMGPETADNATEDAGNFLESFKGQKQKVAQDDSENFLDDDDM